MDRIPVDPVLLEQLPPADIDKCEHCKGHGVVITGEDPDTGVAVDVECTWCEGTGDRRAPLGTPVVRCRRIRAHGPHTYVDDPTSALDLKCPGVLRSAATLGELLRRRPELADVSPLAFAHTLAVSAA